MPYRRRISIFLLVFIVAGNIFTLSAPQAITSAEEGNYPYIASIQHKLNNSTSVHICEGTIIDDQHILTAAHCLNKFNSPSELLVVVGDNNLYNNNETSNLTRLEMNVDKIIIHEKFKTINDPYPFENDIAILKLTNKFDWNEDIFFAPITLRVLELTDESTCTIVGWNSNADDLATLEMSDVEIIHYRTCKYNHKSNTSSTRLVCAGADTRDRSCLGSGGTPLICDKELTGVLSWRSYCGMWKYPSIFTKVAGYGCWIDEKTSGSELILVNYWCLYILFVILFIYHN